MITIIQSLIAWLISVVVIINVTNVHLDLEARKGAKVHRVHRDAKVHPANVVIAGHVDQPVHGVHAAPKENVVPKEIEVNKDVLAHKVVKVPKEHVDQPGHAGHAVNVDHAVQLVLVA